MREHAGFIRLFPVRIGCVPTSNKFSGTQWLKILIFDLEIESGRVWNRSLSCKIDFLMLRALELIDDQISQTCFLWMKNTLLYFPIRFRKFICRPSYHLLGNSPQYSYWSTNIRYARCTHGEYYSWFMLAKVKWHVVLKYAWHPFNGTFNWSIVFFCSDSFQR